MELQTSNSAISHFPLGPKDQQYDIYSISTVPPFKTYGFWSKSGMPLTSNGYPMVYHTIAYSNGYCQEYLPYDVLTDHDRPTHMCHGQNLVNWGMVINALIGSSWGYIEIQIPMITIHISISLG